MVLQKFLKWQMSLTEEGKPLHTLQPLVKAIDDFLYESPNKTKRAPYIRDAVDLKRWMWIVVIALIPCILMAIWNSGIQKFIYTSRDFHLMDEFLQSSTTLSGYFDFVIKDNRYLSILKLGLGAFLPVMAISYIAGGVVEVLFAVIRRHPIAEGFFVTGILYALILPPTIPYWMVAVGVVAGNTLAKELFGGTGMNVMNPALCCRVFLFFTFPAAMTGEIWVGTNPTTVHESVITMNREAKKSVVDGYSQATVLAHFKAGFDVSRIHVDAIGATMEKKESSNPILQKQYELWSSRQNVKKVISELSQDEVQKFVTSPSSEGGLNMAPENYDKAYRFAMLQTEQRTFTPWNFALGNKLGSFGETSIIACFLGALILVITGVGCWKIMTATFLGAYLTALAFQLGASYFGADGGVWNPAMFAFPAYKHLLVGGLAFGAIFMATDPVSAASLSASRWIYGGLIGFLAIIIRELNPAYPEGVMLAILIGNVFAPIIDYYVGVCYRRKVCAARK